MRIGRYPIIAASCVLLILIAVLAGCFYVEKSKKSFGCDKYQKGSELNEAKILSPNQTSSRFLMEYAKLKVCISSNIEKQKKLEKFSIIYDLYIKARSYAILNKVFFGLSLFFAISVLLWPSLGVITKGLGHEKPFLSSAVIQTTVTGIAALSFAFYSHYKNQQTYTENLMRYVIYSQKIDNETLMKRVIEEMAKIDKGMSFSWALEKNKQTVNGK
jgi:hypothetical protein